MAHNIQNFVSIPRNTFSLASLPYPLSLPAPLPWPQPPPSPPLPHRRSFSDAARSHRHPRLSFASPPSPPHLHPFRFHTPPPLSLPLSLPGPDCGLLLRKKRRSWQGMRIRGMAKKKASLRSRSPGCGLASSTSAISPGAVMSPSFWSSSNPMEPSTLLRYKMIHFLNPFQF